MRRTSTAGRSAALLAGAALASCNLTLGLDPYFDTGSQASSGSSGHGGADGGGTGGTDGGGGAIIPPGGALWAHALGTSGDDTVKAIAVGGPMGHIFLTGKTGAAGTLGCPNVGAGPAMGGYLIELNDQGQCVWGLFFGLGAEGTGVAVDNLGNIALTGTFTGDLALFDFVPQSTATNSFVARILANQTLQKAHQLSSDGSNQTSTTGLVATADQIYVVGQSNGKLNIDAKAGMDTTGGLDGFLIGCDTTDMSQCSVSARITGMMAQDQQVLGVALGPGGSEVSVAGASLGKTGFNSTTLTPPPIATDTTANAILASFSAPGSFLNRGVVLGDAQAQSGRCVAYSGSGALYFAGTYGGTIQPGATPLTSLSGLSVFLSRFEGTASTAVHATSLGAAAGSVDQDVHGLAADAAGNVVMVGTLRGTASLGKLSATSHGGDDIYVARLDGSLTPLWLSSFGSSGAESASAVAIDADGGILVAGQFSGSLDLGTGALPHPGMNDIFIAKLKAD
jgi:hypothetical protein